ncbi:MAG: hypothetical protein ABSE56_08740 [Bryobacteraceae bacterium]
MKDKERKHGKKKPLVIECKSTGKITPEPRFEPPRLSLVECIEQDLKRRSS